MISSSNLIEQDQGCIALPPLAEKSPYADFPDLKYLPLGAHRHRRLQAATPEHGTITNGKETSFCKTTRHQARQLIDRNDLTRKTHVIYVDAAIGEQEKQPMFTTAWTSHDATTRGNKHHLTCEAVSSSLAELCAIVDFAEHVSLAQHQTGEHCSHHYRVYTDSEEAYRACHNTRTTTVVVKKLRLYVSYLRALGHYFHVHWIPGHSGIPGNDRAHRLARALLVSAQSKPPERFSSRLADYVETHNQWLDPAITVSFAK
ncbi:hypothetical protein HPB48_004228 [Haemaphysalis longicornis]|uniref:RNase H type-1 domain-containing protein n=1 Tax=Haemaphysalis longicornis TaxID=44386 RepID=A0A9J6GPW4_HAELO|nr:hypothetical protein HPB48_004228 [Haemaphysalis longicornis]